MKSLTTVTRTLFHQQAPVVLAGGNLRNQHVHDIWRSFASTACGFCTKLNTSSSHQYASKLSSSLYIINVNDMMTTAINNYGMKQVSNLGQYRYFHSTPKILNEEAEPENSYLDRVAQELDLKWTSYFKARLLTSKKPTDKLLMSKQILIAKEDELGIEEITKPINYEIPEEFTHYKLIRISDGSMISENIEREEAEAIAENEGLDLILAVTSVSPPIVKLGDYVVFLKHAIIKDKLSELKELEKELAEKKTKEIRFSATIDDHDLDTKMKQIIKFIFQGKKVKIICFRVENEEKGFKLLKEFMNKIRTKIANQLPGIDMKKVLEEEKPFKQKNEFMVTVKIRDDMVAKVKKAKKTV